MTKRKEYQYEVVNLYTGGEFGVLAEQLNKLGQQGWRVVTLLESFVSIERQSYKFLVEMACFVDRESGEWEYE